MAHLATRLAFVALAAAPAWSAAAPLKVSVLTSDEQQVQLRIQGDADRLRRHLTRVRGDHTIRIALPGKSTPRTLRFKQGPLRRLTVRRHGRSTRISLATRQGAAPLARRLRFLEDERTLLITLFASDGALAEWIAAHAGAHVTTPRWGRRPRLRKTARNRATSGRHGSEILVGTPAVLSVADPPAMPGRAAEAPASPTASTRNSPPRKEDGAADSVPAPAPPAATTTFEAPGAPEPEAVVGSMSVTSRVAVVGFLLALAAAALVLRRRSGRLMGAQPPIRVVGSRALGGKHRLSVVEVGEHRFLVALDAAGTHLISRLDAEGRQELAPRRSDEGLVAPSPSPALTPQTLAPSPSPVVPPQPAAAISSHDEVAPNASPRLRLVTPATDDAPRTGRDRTRALRRTVGLEAPATQHVATARSVPVPLDRLMVPAVSDRGRPTAPRASVHRASGAAARSRARTPPPRRNGTAATDPTVHVASTQAADESDVAGLLRLKSSGRRLA